MSDKEKENPFTSRMRNIGSRASRAMTMNPIRSPQSVTPARARTRARSATPDSGENTRSPRTERGRDPSGFLSGSSIGRKTRVYMAGRHWTKGPDGQAIFVKRPVTVKAVDPDNSSRCRRAIAETGVWYYNFSTVQGIHQMRRTDWVAFKIFWFIVFLIGVGLTGYSAFDVVMRYVNNKVVSRIYLEKSKEIKFPAITICNTNALHCGNLYDYLLECQRNSSCRSSEGHFAELCEIYRKSQCNVSITIAEMTHYGLRTSPPICLHSSAPRWASHDEERWNFHKLLGGLKPNIRKRISPQPSDLIQSCKFSIPGLGKQECETMKKNNGPYDAFLLEDRGLCPTFNFHPFPSKISPLQFPTEINALVSLELVINIESLYYPREHSPALGVDVYVHPCDTFPGFSRYPKIAAPNTHLLLNLRRSTFEEGLSEPCQEVFGEDYEKLTAHKYDKSICMYLCIIEEFRKKYECVPYGMADYFFDYSNERICDPWETKKFAEKLVESKGDRSEERDVVEQSCSCPKECSSEVFNIQHSEALWPDFFDIPQLLKDSKRKTIKNMTISEHVLLELEAAENFEAFRLYKTVLDHVKNNYLRLQFYFEDTTIIRHKEAFQYPVYGILDALGGVISLYLGMSVASLFEVLEFIVRLIVSMVRAA